MDTTLSSIEPAKRTKLLLLRQEAEIYINTRYTLQARHRMSKRVGADKSLLDSIESELERCEKYLMVLDEEVKELEASE